MDRLEEPAAGLRVEVGRGREAHAAHQGGGQVAQDVAEHVAGDDDVEVAWILDQLHGGRVDKKMLGLDVRRPRAFKRKHPLPEIVRQVQRIALVDHGQPPGMTRGAPLLCQLERISLDPLDTLARVHVFLDGDLVDGVALELDEQVDADAQRQGGAEQRPPAHRLLVAAREEHQAQREDAREEDHQRHHDQVGLGHGTLRSANRTEVDRARFPELLEHGVGNDLAGPQVALGAQVIADKIERRVDRPENADALRNNLGTDAIARDNRDPKRHRLQNIDTANAERFGLR